jgi:hypothetical protein
VEWGGAEFRLENPAPEAPPEQAAEAQAAVPPTPLPEGPLMFAVRLNPANGSARSVPIAVLSSEGLLPLEFPEDPDDTWRARFAERFLPAGRELELHGAGRRIGSLVLDGSVTSPRADCMPVAAGRALFPAGSQAPSTAFAFEPDSLSGQPARYSSFEADNRMRTFGPILAEQLLRSRGENRPFLAQRAELEAVSWPGDANPAFAATYLINDALDAPAPDGQAVSLFFLARFDPARGYYPVWSEFRRYGNGAGKEVFSYLTAVDSPAGRIDFVELRDGSGAVRLAASLGAEGAEDRRVDWTEEENCRAQLLLAP